MERARLRFRVEEAEGPTVTLAVTYPAGAADGWAFAGAITVAGFWANAEDSPFRGLKPDDRIEVELRKVEP